MDDNENPDNEEIIMDTEEASSTVEEASIPDEPSHLNEELCNKFLDFPPPEVSLARAGVKSFCIEQMILLRKMDPRSLKEKTKHKDNCYTHECKKCGRLIKLP